MPLKLWLSHLVLAYPTAVVLEATLVAFRQISPLMRLI